MKTLFALLYIIGFTLLLLSTIRKDRGARVLNAIDQSRNVASNLSKTKDTRSILEKVVAQTSITASISDKLDKSLGLKTLIILIAAIVLWVMYSFKVINMHYHLYLITLIVCLILVIVIPGRIGAAIVKKKIKSFSENLPYVVDLISVCVQSGMTIEAALEYVSDNIGTISPELSVTFHRITKQVKLNGMEQALNELHTEIPTPEVRAFCTTLQQSSSYGTSIYETLVALSADIREMQLLAVEEKVSSLSAKMTVPMMLFIMFPLIVIVAGPGFIGMLNVWSK